MAFKSIGPKYGFVSAGDVYRQRIAEERQKAEKKREQDRIDTKNVLRNIGLSEEQIAEVCSQLDVMRQSRILQKQD